MSLRSFRESVVIALLTMFTASRRCVAVYIQDPMTGFEHKVTPLQTQHFQVMSVMNFDLCDFQLMTKYENFIVVLCTYLTSDAVDRTYIRIYEDQAPFDLLMIIDAELMQHSSRYTYIFNDMVSSSAAKSIFIARSDVGVWQMRWEDHELKRFLFPGNVTFQFRMSVSEQGHLQLFDVDNVFVYDSVGTLIREMPLFANVYYRLYTPIGEYGYPVSLSTSSSNGETLNLDFHLREITLHEISDTPDFTEIGTTECIDPSLTRTIFFANYFPGKYPNCELYKLTVSLLLKESEFSCSEQVELESFNPIISVDNNQLEFWYVCNDISTEEWCFLPNASDSQLAEKLRKRLEFTPDEKIELFWQGSYFFDTDKNQLVLSFLSFLDHHDDLFILRLE